MLFNSFAFFVFFPVTAAGYFALPHKWRWLWLLAASCYFYSYFIPVYLLILGFTIVVDYVAGLLIERAAGPARRRWLALSIAANVGVLAVFKYFNFVNSNLESLAHAIGWSYPIQSLSIALPVGLSFHTFQAMSYTIEVYRGHQKAERHFGIYALYVMFFPQLVAGPIERPQNLLHQFRERHDFEYGRIASGLRLIAWGLFKKAVVADRLALAVNTVYADPAHFNGPPLALASVLFAFQIFFDFSGYSDIALGTARVMGFSLMENFDRPYRSRSISEFWRRWHISLSTWFRDYLYFPLGGNRVPVPRWYFNLLLVFLVSGLWHGANWTFVAWGALHGVYLLFGAATAPLRERVAATLGLSEQSFVRNALRVLGTFALVDLGWIFFRAASVHDAWDIISRLPTGWGELTRLSALTKIVQAVGLTPLGIVVGVGGIILIETAQFLRARQSAAVDVVAWPGPARWVFYYMAAAALFFLWIPDSDQFIYFQF